MQSAIYLLAMAAAFSGPLDQGGSVTFRAARPNSTTASTSAHLQHCLVSLIDEVQVPALETGLLVSIVVKEGNTVSAGTLLAQIDDQQPRLDQQAAEAEHDAATVRASDDIEIRFAEASFDVADAEMLMNMEINHRSPGSVPTTEIRRLRLARHKAELQIDKSKLDTKVAKLTADVQQSAVLASIAAVTRRRIVSPIEGMVVAIYRHQGEWVNSGEPVVGIVRMNRLRVEGFIDAAQYNPGEINGRKVTIMVNLARGRQIQFPGNVVFVSPQIQAGNKYRVRVEVTNRQENKQWLLRPGSAAEMTIHLR